MLYILRLQHVPTSCISVLLINHPNRTLERLIAILNISRHHLISRACYKRTATRYNSQPASMAPHDQTGFQPTPPVRTPTVDSQKSTDSSGEMSSTSAPASPTSRAFFGAITERLRERSRSRSRPDASRKRANSPMVLPPEQLTTARPQQARHVSQPTPTQAPAKAPRPSLQDNGRMSTGGSDPWRGRHSNEWLFGGFSVRNTARGVLERRKS